MYYIYIMYIGLLYPNTFIYFKLTLSIIILSIFIMAVVPLHHVVESLVYPTILSCPVVHWDRGASYNDLISGWLTETVGHPTITSYPGGSVRPWGILQWPHIRVVHWDRGASYNDLISGWFPETVGHPTMSSYPGGSLRPWGTLQWPHIRWFTETVGHPTMTSYPGGSLRPWASYNDLISGWFSETVGHPTMTSYPGGSLRPWGMLQWPHIRVVRYVNMYPIILFSCHTFPTMPSYPV